MVVRSHPSRPIETILDEAIADEAVYVLLPDSFPTAWIEPPVGASQAGERSSSNRGAEADGASDGAPQGERHRAARSVLPVAGESLLAPTSIPLPRTVEALEEDVFSGAHPALAAARHARDEEDLLADIEEEIEREIAVELRPRRRVSGKFLAITAAILVPVLLPTILYVGWPYYSLSTEERALHPFHETLRSSGRIGLPLGFLALGVMTANLTYLIRKKLVSRLGVKTLPGWLRFHIATGLLGPFIALFHAGFVPTSAMGIFSMLSMAIVVVSGIVGRYILAYVPKQDDAEELALTEVRRRLVVYKRKLMALGVRTAFLDIEPRRRAKRDPGLIISMIRVAWGDHAARRDMRRLRREIELRSSGDSGDAMRVLVTRLCRERQWMMRSQEMRRFIVAWRFFHRWFAIVLFSAVAFHVWVALRFGGLLG